MYEAQTYEAILSRMLQKALSINYNFDYFRFRGTRWNHTNIEQRQQYQKNAYRVLLTRARQGLVIYIPEGSQEDQSRIPALYDGTYRYLLSCGIPEI